jgi:hypothetical protein
MLRHLHKGSGLGRHFSVSRQTKSFSTSSNEGFDPLLNNAKPFEEVPHPESVKFLKDTQLEVSKLTKERTELDLFFQRVHERSGDIVRVDPDADQPNIFIRDATLFRESFKAKDDAPRMRNNFFHAYKTKRNIPEGINDATDITTLKPILNQIYADPKLMSEDSKTFHERSGQFFLQIVSKFMDPYTKSAENLPERSVCVKIIPPHYITNF